MPYLKYTINIVIEAIYKYYVESNSRGVSLEKLHSIIQNRLTVMPKTIANYLKQLVAIGLMKLESDGSFTITDKLIAKGIELEKEYSYANTSKEKDSKTDELGFFKY